MNKFIFDLQRFANIYNTTYNTLISGTSGNDSIKNYGESVTIDAGAGNDYIDNNASEVLIKYSGGNDTIEGFGNYSTLKIASGTLNSLANANGTDLILSVGNDKIMLKDVLSLSYTPHIVDAKGKEINCVVNIVGTNNADNLYNNMKNSTINALGGNDYITNYGDSVSINAGDGDDSIKNYGFYVTVDGGAGNDYIYNKSSYVSIDGGAGNDYIYNDNYNGSGYNMFIYSGAGDDTIYNVGDSITINAGDGDDYIDNHSSEVTINGGAGNDSIYNGYSSVSIDAGAGNDYIDNNASEVLIKYSGGNDTIEGFGNYSTLKIASGTLNSLANANGTDLILSVGNDKIMLKDVLSLSYTPHIVDAKGKEINCVVNLVGTNNADSLYNNMRNSTINALGGKDYISNRGNSVTINAGEGDDYIDNWGYYATIDGGAGNDYIYNNASEVLIKYSGGNDTIRGLDSTSTLQIASGTLNPLAEVNGKDVILSVGNDKITLKGVLTYSDSPHIVDAKGKELNCVLNLVGTNDEDSLYNNMRNSTINALGGNDDIYNYGESVTIDGGAGEDYIYNRGNSVTINAGEGDDYIDNWGYYATIDGGAGDDTIYNVGDSITINAGDGDDSIYNGASSVTIDAGAGDDSVYNSYSSVSIDGDAGDDTIENHSYGVTINGGAGNDYIYNTNYDYQGNNVFVYSGGNDTIAGLGNSTLQIASGTLNPLAEVNGKDVILSVGNDKITLKDVLSSSYTPYIVDAKGKELICGVNLVGTNDEDSLYNNMLNSTINALGGDDSITNNGSYGSINGGDGDDSIYNNGLQVTINGGVGDDSIYNDGSEVSINGGAGDDSIYNNGWNSYGSIDGGAGNDYIYNGGNYVLFVYSGGNDTIAGFSDNSTLKIAAGTFNSLADINGTDLILSVGNDKITLKDVLTYSDSPHIVDANGKELIYGVNLVGTNDADNLYNFIGHSTINALGGNDSITNNGSYGSINAGGGDDSIKNYGFYVTVDGGAGNDYISNEYYSDNVLFVYSGGNDSIYGFHGTSTLQIASGTINSITNVYGSDDLILSVGNDKITLKYFNDTPNIVDANGKAIPAGIIRTYTEKAENISNYREGTTIQALGGNDEISNYGGKNVSISGGTGDDKINNTNWTNWDDNLGNVTVTPDNTTIDGGAGNDSIYNDGSQVTINGGDGDDEISNNYGEKVSINGGAGNDYIYNNDGSQVTINGGDGDDEISNNYGEKVSINGGAGNDYIYNGGSQVTIDGGAGNDSITNSSLNVLFTYAPGGGKDSIEGFGETDTLQIGNGNDTFSKDTVDNDVVVTVGKGSIKLVGAAGIADSGMLNVKGKEIFNYIWTFDGTKATYGKPNQILTEVSGVTSKNGLSINGKIVTVSKSALGKNTVMISNGYTLKLADDVTLSQSTQNWSHNNKSIATLKQKTTQGYRLSEDGMSISYYTAKTDTLLTVKGVKSAKGLELNDTVVKVPAAVLNGNKVTISDGYSLALAKDVKQSKTSENWSYSNAVATYKKVITPGYTLSENESSITYLANEDNITVNVKGVKSKKGLSIDGTTVTVANSALNKKTVTIDKGYNLALANDVAKSKTTESWSYNNPTATLKRTTTTGYSLADDENSIAYSKQATATLAKVKGAKKTSGLTVDDNIITLNNAALNNRVTISGSDEFDFAADYNKATIAGSGNKETITTRGSNILINSGAGNDSINILGSSTSVNGGKGNDSITSNGKGNVFVYTNGDGNDVITNYAEEDKIKITSGKVSKTKVSGNDVVLTVGSGKITVKNAKGKTVTYIAENGIEYTYPESMKFNEEITAATLLSGFTKDKFNVANYGSLLNTVDASAVVRDIEIVGNRLANDIKGSSQDDLIDGGAGADTLDGGKGNDSLSGGAGNDSIIGGKGNDTLTGGKGADIFVFSKNDGKDLITDYNEEDTIKFLSGTAKATTKKDDVIFTVGNGKITVAGGNDKIITYVDSKGVEYTYPKTLKFTKKNTSVKILANYNKDNFNVADYGEEIYTIDASAVVHDTSIVGNKKANKITGSSQDDKLLGDAGADTLIGGKGNDTINGGTGNDSIVGGKGNDNLTGGDGADIFVYSKGDGKDTITDYNEEDTIKFLSGTAKATTKKKDVIFTVESGKITVKGGKDKIITYVDSKGVEYTYPKTLTYNADSTSVKILAAYNKDSFNIADYGEELNTVDASAVLHAISIKGNRKANKITGSSQDDKLLGDAGADTLIGGKGNDMIDGGAGNDSITGGNGNDTLIGGKGSDKIYGGKGNDSLWGGIGDDTLYGGEGEDIFVYTGEGKDVIADFAEIDTIMVLSGKVGDYSATKSNVTFKVGKGQIVVQNAADKYIELVDDSGNTLSHYSPKKS